MWPLIKFRIGQIDDIWLILSSIFSIKYLLLLLDPDIIDSSLNIKDLLLLSVSVSISIFFRSMSSLSSAFTKVHALSNLTLSKRKGLISILKSIVLFSVAI